MIQGSKQLPKWRAAELEAWRPKGFPHSPRVAECARLGYCVATHNGEYLSHQDVKLALACAALGRCILAD